ncbi:MAG TPA: alpha/beta hydrolase [Trebonia sp.]|jgi:pimeloyl-ACP methyl ester carboxylesterase|nr:alpha/beta hydrolase [Trebonia sp.]
MTEPMTHTLRAPGAVLHYDIRSADAGKDGTAGTDGPPALLIVGSPMGADGFVTLAGHFTDRTVVTYDPRGAGRSPRTDGALRTEVEEHADDLHRIITALDSGPVDVFASSGGAVNALALAARHPDQVRTLVAHEPPSFGELPDSEYALAAAADIHATYQRAGYGPGMAKFIALLSQQGPLTAGYANQPAPPPAAFGLPAADDGSRTDPLLGLNMLTCGAYEHDFDALRAGPSRVVIGVGEESGEAIAGRAGASIARRLGVPPVIFPGGHDGFAGGEFGRAGKPDAFAAVLREVLAGQ